MGKIASWIVERYYAAFMTGRKIGNFGEITRLLRYFATKSYGPFNLNEVIFNLDD